MDELKTREDVSKIVFHVMVEHILALEMDHVLGLIAFGEAVTAFDITRDYEKFHLELGRLDANQNRTKLFDAILAAGQCLETFVAGAKAPVAQGAPLRIFALTDGEDDASSNTAWAVTQWLQDHHVVLDVFPMASRLPVLQAMATATGGICVDVANEEQGMKLFESEPLLHCASRNPPAKKPVRVSCEADLNSLSGSSAAPMREVVSQKCHTVAPTHALTHEQAVPPAPRRPGAHFSLTLWACLAVVVCFGVVMPWGGMIVVQRVGTVQSLSPATLPFCQLQ